MNRPAVQSVHALEVPTGGVPLLLPSACIAEVVSVTGMTPVPRSEPWVIGVTGWRLRPVPVISFEALTGQPVSATGARSRIVILYPLPGRRDWEFLGILSITEPQPRTIDSSVIAVSDEHGRHPYIAVSMQVGSAIVGIPDFEALKATLYPSQPRA